MHFDIRTLLVAVALATAFCAAARVLLWQMHRDIPGLGRWALAGLMAVPALVLIAARQALPDLVLLSLAQLLIAGGLALVWDGFRRFVGRVPLAGWVWLLLGLVVLAGLVAAHLTDSFAFRAGFNATMIAMLSAAVAWELFSASRKGALAMRVTGGLYAANAVFFLWRSASIALQGSTVGPLNPDGYAALALFWWLGMTLAITLGMVLMTAEYLKRVLDHQASHDPLTGALNRRAFALMAAREIARAQRTGQPLSALMLDLDNFKQVNDCLGHSVGDLVLCRFVSVAEQILREVDVFCRYGGEEFVALLPGASADQALAVAERLRTAYSEQAADIDRRRALAFGFTVSVGVSQWQEGEDIDALLRRIDQGLYQAKAQGRNRSQLAEEPVDTLPGPEDGVR